MFCKQLNGKSRKREVYGFIVVVCVVLFTSSVANAAVYSWGLPTKSNITDLYQSMVIVSSGQSLYSAQQIGGGYVGFFGNTDPAGRGINFSIWDNGLGGENYVIEGPDPALGGTTTRFWGEGEGAKTSLFLNWEYDVLYKIYVKNQHVNGGTIVSAWIGRQDTPGEWYSCGRVYSPDSLLYTGGGGHFLETLSDHEGLLGMRINGITRGWVGNRSGWEAMSGLAWLRASHVPNRASGYWTDDVLYLTFGADNPAPWYPDDYYVLPPDAVTVVTPSTEPDTMPDYIGQIDNDVQACPAKNSISKTSWTIHYVDSEMQSSGEGAAVNVLDDDPYTFWHTQWQGGLPSHPHEIQIDMQSQYDINGFGYRPRIGFPLNGAIDDYEFYVSTDGTNWGSPVSSGSWGGIIGLGRKETFPPVTARYVRLVALSECYGLEYSSASEIYVYEVVTNNPPTFTDDPIVEADARIGNLYSGSIAENATDSDAEDTLAFSKVSGPGWLTVTSWGGLTGTPSSGDIGLNTWTVQVDDGDGGSDQATLEITVIENNISRDIVTHLTMDTADISGSTIYDTSLAPYYDATIISSSGNPTGQINEALTLDGVNDYATIPAMNLNSNTVTISAWIKRNGIQSDWAGIVYNRAGSTVAGLSFGADEELRYTWDGNYWGVNTGLIVPDNTWSHVALVVEPDKATVFLNGNYFINHNPHAVDAFDNITQIGADGSVRRFKGDIDDVAIWDRSLTFSEISQIYALGLGGNTFPNPPTPDPMTWATVPYAVGDSSSIAMVATTATDRSGVEYYFTCIAGGGNDSGWQDSTSYTDTGLTPEATYTYTVTARDKSTNQDTTAASTAESATNQLPADIDGNGFVGPEDLVLMAARWLDSPCAGDDWCSMTDLNFSDKVDLFDLSILADDWGYVCMPVSCYVGTIVTSTANGTYGRKKYQATVVIYDDCDNSVADATVTGTFTGAFTEQVIGVTDLDGVAVLTTNNQITDLSFTFCVDEITHAELTYEPTDNVETCDSY